MVAQKCPCIIAKKTGGKCYLHNEGKPENIGLLKRLGYNIEIKNGKIKIIDYNNENNISKGDISFVQLISKCLPINEEFIHSEIASIKLKNEKKIVCTSSWFQWATQKICTVGCWYCFADYNSEVRIDLPDFGCNPIEIFKNLDI